MSPCHHPLNGTDDGLSVPVPGRSGSNDPSGPLPTCGLREALMSVASMMNTHSELAQVRLLYSHLQRVCTHNGATKPTHTVDRDAYRTGYTQWSIQRTRTHTGRTYGSHMRISQCVDLR